MPSPGDQRLTPPTGGLFGSLRRLVTGLLELGQVRFELLCTEIEQQKLRIFDGLLWAAVAFLFFGVGLLLLLALLVALAPESLRPLVLGLLSLSCLGLGVWLMLQARRRLAPPGGALPASRTELERDLNALRPPE